MDRLVITELGRLIGEDNVLTSEAELALATADLFPSGTQPPAQIVLRPRSTEETASVVRHLCHAGAQLVPRGAGLSYTGGVEPEHPSVVIDTLNLNTIRVAADDLYARVGAGVTWEALAEALRPFRLKCAQPSPISGAKSTIGGTAAQGIPGGTDGFLGAMVVLADGSVVQTGAATLGEYSGFSRFNGPDLTGLFLGDCGAFGIKTELIVQLVPIKPACFASFAFASASALLEAMVALLRGGLVTRAFAMDPMKSKGVNKVDAGEAVSILGAVVAQSGSLRQSVKDVAQLVRGGPKTEGWTLHLTVEAVTETGAEAQLAAAKRVCASFGQEVDNIIPKTLHAKPYSIRGFVGPLGERWVPVHGMLALSRAQACISELLAFAGSQAVELRAFGIEMNWLISSIGTYVTIEAMFYWSDALDAIHFKHLSARNAERFKHAKPNEAARRLIAELRLKLRDIYSAHGSAHAQTGRFYQLPESAFPLLRTLKHALDPDGAMNPGVLGL